MEQHSRMTGAPRVLDGAVRCAVAASVEALSAADDVAHRLAPRVAGRAWVVRRLARAHLGLPELDDLWRWRVPSAGSDEGQHNDANQHSPRYPGELGAATARMGTGAF